jgi:cell division protease FtsH
MTILQSHISNSLRLNANYSRRPINQRKYAVKITALQNPSYNLPDHVPTISESIVYAEDLKRSTIEPRFDNKLLKVPDNIFRKPEESSYSSFMKDLHNKSIAKATVTQDEKVVKIQLNNGTEQVIVLPLAIGIVDTLLEHNVDVTMKYIKDATDNSVFDMSSVPQEVQVIVAIVEILLIGGLITTFLNIMQRSGNTPNGMNNFIGMNKEITLDKSNVTFADIAGVDIAKQELMEIVDFLKNPEKYTIVGAKIPRGILLCGPPGVGKTLLARAIAGEAEVPFFSCSGSDFIEMFVGVGASRVRDLFKKAREKAPCILFIDEIDTIGKQRSAGGPGVGNDERDQTINQLLTLMDGFEGNLGVIVVAATNRPDILDSALLRPGRFDRRVIVDLPDIKGRYEILQIHTKTRPLAEDVNLQQLARITVGFSGADLNNLCNEAAIYAARLGNENVNQVNFENALEKITLGEERRTMLVTEQKKRVLAYHEAGHALIGLIMNDFDIVRKVSIVPRGMTGGATYFEPLDEHVDMALMTREYLENKIMVALGGRVAEEIIFGTSKITTGASGDLQIVQNIANDMITQFGFNDTLGLANWEDNEGISDIIFYEMKVLIDKLYERTYFLITKNIIVLDVIATALIEKETLNYEELIELVEGLECPLDVETLNTSIITTTTKTIIEDD